MDSKDDRFNLQSSGLSAIDVDDRSGGAVITIKRSRRHGKFALMHLPLELRLRVFSFLLPDVDEIDPGNEWGCTQSAGESYTDIIWTTYRHDGAPCEMAIMRTNRQIYDETAGYLYDRLTVIVHIESDGVNFLTMHWGCGEVARCMLTSFPLHKSKCVWLQVHASYDQPKHLAHVRINLLDFCCILYQLESLNDLRVDFWDYCHCREGTMMGFEEPTGVQSCIKVATKDTEYLIADQEYTTETAERKTWRAANSTGTALVATDIELILQPLKLLRNVKSCRIFLNPKLQENTSLVELTARYKEIIESKREHTLEDLKFVHETSEDLYRLARSVHGEIFCISLFTATERMESLLWHTRKWHSMEAEPGRQRWLNPDGTCAYEIDQSEILSTRRW